MLPAAEPPDRDPQRVFARAMAWLSQFDSEMAEAIAGYFMFGVPKEELLLRLGLDGPAFQRRWDAALAWLKANPPPPSE